MSFVMRLSQLLTLTSGNLINGDCQFSHLSTDTRKVVAGDVFLALSGEQFDGHDFCRQAVASGAVALVVERALPLDVPQLIVSNCHLALGVIAKYNRDQYSGRLIAVTGSNGKTTTKEIIATIFRGQGTTLATLGNLNNEIGVPLTLLGFDGSQQCAVVEMGANHRGEIAYCTRLAQPDVAIITNAMAAHLEGFGSLQGVVQAKGEIFEGLKEDGIAILNLDDDNVNQWIAQTQVKRYLSFSLTNNHADVYASDLEQLPMGNYRFVLHYLEQRATVTLALLALHNVHNALAAAASTFAIGVNFSRVVEGLQSATTIPGRLKALPGINGATVIDDSYNGNPDSVKAGLDLLAQLPGHTILALGDMAELGPDASELHRSIGIYAAEKKIDQLFSCGVEGALAATEFATITDSTVTAFDNKNDMINTLKKIMNKQTKILIKGSLSAGMKEVVTALTARGDS